MSTNLHNGQLGMLKAIKLPLPAGNLNEKRVSERVGLVLATIVTFMPERKCSRLANRLKYTSELSSKC